MAGAAEADGSGSRAGAGTSIRPAVAGTTRDGCFSKGGSEDTPAAAGCFFIGTSNCGSSELIADFGVTDAGALGVVGCKAGGACNSGAVCNAGVCVGVGNAFTEEGVACNAGMAGCTTGASAGSPLAAAGGAAGNGN